MGSMLLFFKLMSFGCSFELTRRGKIKPVMELNTVNLELDFKVFSFSLVLF